MICCKCGGVFYQTSRCKVREEGVIQRHYYKCNKCAMPLTTSEVEIEGKGAGDDALYGQKGIEKLL